MNLSTHMSSVSDNDALPLEYKLLNWQPLRQVDVAHFIGDAALQSYLSVHESHFQEQSINVIGPQVGVPHHDVGNH